MCQSLQPLLKGRSVNVRPDNSFCFGVNYIRDRLARCVFAYRFILHHERERLHLLGLTVFFAFVCMHSVDIDA